MLTELLQNAVDHGFPEGSGGGKVVVALDNDDERLAHRRHRRRPRPRTRLRRSTRRPASGLSIVRTLVTTELNGQISMRPAKAADLAAAGLEEHGGDHGTVIELTVPLRDG